jgi:hypothetical protein
VNPRESQELRGLVLGGCQPNRVQANGRCRGIGGHCTTIANRSLMTQAALPVKNYRTAKGSFDRLLGTCECGLRHSETGTSFFCMAVLLTHYRSRFLLQTFCRYETLLTIILECFLS